MRLVFLCLLFLCSAAPALADPWLFLSDIHLDPTSSRDGPVERGKDSNFALLDAAIAEMRRVDPHPPVIVISGDFLAHHFDYSRATETMVGLARRFDRAFPHAQFVIAIGNEDSGCGDYAIAPNAPFLRAVAKAWLPLVNRHGAAPAFARTFARDGFYVARLPVPHLDAVVVNDVFWSPRYHAGCGDADHGGGSEMSADLRSALHVPATERHWVVAHIPPGIDAFSTAHLAHHLVVVPFLDPGKSEAFAAMLADPTAHVSLMLAAHSHKFSYRLIERPPREAVPILQIPSISPIFLNAPAFLVVDVDSTGTIRSAEDHAFDDDEQWRDVGGTRTLGLTAFTGAQVAKLHARMARDPDLRALFARLYNSGVDPEINERNWRVYWCSASEFSATRFRACLDEKGYSVLTRRGIVVIGVVAVSVLAVVIAGIAILRARKRAVRNVSS